MLAIVAVVQKTLLTGHGVELDVVALTALAGTILPLLTATLTNITASSKVKAIVNAVLSIVTGTVAALIAVDGKMTWAQLVIAIAVAFGASGASYSHLWKQLNVTAWIAVATGYFGFGRNQQLVQTLHQISVTNAELRKAVSHPLGFRRAVTALEATHTLTGSLVTLPPDEVGITQQVDAVKRPDAGL